METSHAASHQVPDCVCLQAYVRGLLARRETRALRQQKAAVNIQTAWRRYKMRQQYNLVLHNITAVQVGAAIFACFVPRCCLLCAPLRLCYAWRL